MMMGDEREGSYLFPSAFPSFATAVYHRTCVGDHQMEVATFIQGADVLERSDGFAIDEEDGKVF